MLRIAPRFRRRPVQRRSQETVNAIVEAAAQVFQRGGVEISTNAIAERAGVSIGSLYEYFPDKDGLIAAILERCAQRTLDVLSLEAARQASAPLAQAIAAVVDVLLDEQERQRAITGVLLGQPVYVPLVHADQTMTDKYRQALVTLLSTRRDEIRVLDLEQAAYLLLQGLDGMFDALAVSRPEYLADPAFRGALKHLVLCYLTRGR